MPDTDPPVDPNPVDPTPTPDPAPTPDPTPAAVTIEQVLAAASDVSDHQQRLGLAISDDTDAMAVYQTKHTAAIAEDDAYAASFDNLETLAAAFQKQTPTIP